jgi:hypothetical protein
MSRRTTASTTSRPELTERRTVDTTTASAVERELLRAFSPEVMDDLRARTRYNPRQRVITALRLTLTVVEAFLVGQTLSFASLRAIFTRRYQGVWSCPFQLRLKQPEAVAFFREALRHLVGSVVATAGIQLEGALAKFADVRLIDGTGQRVPPRGRKNLPACTEGRAGTKWVMGYSIKTGLLEEGICGAETSAEIPLWHQLVPSLTRGVLYVLDLGFFERQLFIDALAAGAYVIMRLKSNVKVRVVGHLYDRTFVELPGWSLSSYLKSAPRARGTLFDLDVIWGVGKNAVSLRLVGFAHKANNIRWYLTTVRRDQLSARQVVEAYRLRWLIELLFREIKQATDFGRSFTANPHAVQALTYGAMIAHVLVRSLRIHAALAADVPLEQLRPLACLHVARAFAREIVNALASTSRAAWARASAAVGDAFMVIAREKKPSRSRPRIALRLGAVGG